MYHIRLAKALSYSGIVSATKKNPDVFVEDKATADAAVATGYFVHVEERPSTAHITGHLDKGQLDSMKLADLKKLAEDMGIDTKGLKSKADLVAAIAAEEVEAGDIVDPDDTDPEDEQPEDDGKGDENGSTEDDTDPEGGNTPDYGEEE